MQIVTPSNNRLYQAMIPFFFFFCDKLHQGVLKKQPGFSEHDVQISCQLHKAYTTGLVIEPIQQLHCFVW